MKTVESASSEYLAKIEVERDYYSLRKVMADAIGVNPSTLQRWRIVRPSPEGLVWLKTAFFLESHGYEIQELHSLNPDIRSLGLHLAHNRIDPETAFKELGMTQKSQVFRLFRDGIVPYQPRLLQIRKLVGSLSPAAAQSSSVLAVTRKQLLPSDEEIMFRRLNAVLVILDSAASLIHSDLESLLSDDFTSKQRDAFRDHVDPTKFFHLSNRVGRTVKLLNALGSETARGLASRKEKS
jgi:hypothetical protein